MTKREPRSKSNSVDEKVYACPTELWEGIPDIHRPKCPTASFMIPAAVAQPASKKEIENIPKALEASERSGND